MNKIYTVIVYTACKATVDVKSVALMYKFVSSICEYVPLSKCLVISKI